MKMVGEIPTTVNELQENREFYQERLDERNANCDGFMGSVLLPREGASEMAVRGFHEAMTMWGYAGIEYAQEALHGNGDYFDDFFESVEDLRDDLERYAELREEINND